MQKEVTYELDDFLFGISTLDLILSYVLQNCRLKAHGFNRGMKDGVVRYTLLFGGA
jgi:hypothetical protein